MCIWQLSKHYQVIMYQFFFHKLNYGHSYGFHLIHKLEFLI